MGRKKDLIYLLIISIISAVAFIYLLIKIGKIGVGKFRTYYIVFNNTKGLAEKSDVRLGGLKIGFVDKMKIIIEGNEIKVEAEIKVKEGVPIRKDFEAQIRMKSLLGEKYIELAPTGEGSIEEAPEGFKITRSRTLFEPDELILAMKPIIDSLNPDMIKEMTGTLTEFVRTTEPLIKNTSEMISNINEITPELKELTVRFYKSSDDIAKIVRVFSENSNEINKSISELPKLIDNLNMLMNSLSKTLQDGNAILSTVITYQDNLTYSTALLPQVLESVLKISSFATNMIPEFQKLVTQTNSTLEKLQQVLDKGVKVRVF